VVPDYFRHGDTEPMYSECAQPLLLSLIPTDSKKARCAVLLKDQYLGPKKDPHSSARVAPPAMLLSAYY
jgi:hypothetical protein